MLSLDRQREAQMALRQLDEKLTAEVTIEEAVQKHAQELRDQIFSAFQFIERESLQSRTLLVQTKRLDANLLQIQVRGRSPTLLFLDAELAFDQKAQREGEGKPELSARLYALFAPPSYGVLRHYTIFASGEWKRTVFISRTGAVATHVALLTTINQDVLVEEATNLLSQACAVHPTWNNIADSAAALGLDQLRDRKVVKRDPLGV